MWVDKLINAVEWISRQAGEIVQFFVFISYVKGDCRDLSGRGI